LFSPLYNKAEVRWYPDSSRLYPRSSRISRINFADGSFAGGTMALKVLRSGKRIFPVSTSETGSKRAAGLPWRMITISSPTATASSRSVVWLHVHLLFA
jgi:hypothetical protein